MSDRFLRLVRYAAAPMALAACLTGLSARAAPTHPTAAAAHMGFVVSAFGNVRTHGPTTCPNGVSKGYREIFAASPDGQRRSAETDAAYTERLDNGMMQIAMHDGQSICMNPTLGPHDPNFRTMSALNVSIDGIDLDGQRSRARSRPAPGTCAHDDFIGADGARDIDNQFLRVLGCGRVAHENSAQTGQSGLTIEMMTGSWGILLALDGVDDQRNDPDIRVRIYANADPIQLGADHEPLANATYSPERDPRFRAVAHGRIVNGVLTTDPVDMRFHSVLNGMTMERPLRAARLRLTFAADGALEGYLAGYTPLDAMYDMEIGFRTGMRNGALAPAQLRIITGTGKASVLGYTCEGAYQAMQQLADGDRDPATGRCGSVSTQYHMRAIPAFVADNN